MLNKLLGPPNHVYNLLGRPMCPTPMPPRFRRPCLPGSIHTNFIHLIILINHIEVVLIINSLLLLMDALYTDKIAIYLTLYYTMSNEVQFNQVTVTTKMN